jgi:hypothetical protein
MKAQVFWGVTLCWLFNFGHVSEKRSASSFNGLLENYALRSLQTVFNIFRSNQYNIPEALDFSMILDTNQKLLNSITLLCFAVSLRLNADLVLHILRVFRSHLNTPWGGVVVKALRYESEGPGIDSRSLQIFSGASDSFMCPGIDSVFKK